MDTKIDNFWTSFGTILEPILEPKIHQKDDQKGDPFLDKKGGPGTRAHTHTRTVFVVVELGLGFLLLQVFSLELLRALLEILDLVVLEYTHGADG